MSRMIDGDALLENYGLKDAVKYGGKDRHGYDTLMLYEIRDMIDAAPTIDPVKQDNALMVEKLEVGNGSIDMSLSGTPARFFMAGLINLFKHSGAENFLVLTVSDRETNYAITIQDSKKSVTPAQKLAELTARAEAAEEERDKYKAAASQVKHGRWVGTYGATCNLCGYIDVAAYVGRKPNYCPSCGAKMDGEIVADQDAAKTAALDGQDGKKPCDCKYFRGGPDCGMDGDAHE